MASHDQTHADSDHSDGAYATTAVTVTRMRSGLYYAPRTFQSTGARPNNSLEVSVLRIPRSLTLDRIGIEVTAAGQAGAIIRLGLWEDDGNGYPGALIVAAQVAGDAIAVAEATISVAVVPSLYWVGAVTQSAATTQPTTRININGGLALPLGAQPGSATATTVSSIGWLKSSVSTALTAFPAGGSSGSGSIHRVFVRIA